MQVSSSIVAGMLLLAIGSEASTTTRTSGLGRGLQEATVRNALAELESGHLRNPDRAKGSSGEISRFQILPKVWHRYSQSRKYTDPAEAWNVARQILHDRQKLFVEETGRYPSAFELYLLWNKPGLYQSVEFDRSRLPRKLTSRASRFENLVQVGR